MTFQGNVPLVPDLLFDDCGSRASSVEHSWTGDPMAGRKKRCQKEKVSGIFVFHRSMRTGRYGVRPLQTRAPVAEEEGEVGGADGAVGVEVGGVVGARAPIAQENG